MNPISKDVIRYFGKPYKIIRQAPGSYSGGNFVPGVTTTLEIEASIQPLTGQQMIRVPEGNRNTARKMLYTVTQLFADSQETLTKADSIILEGIVFDVEDVDVFEGFYACRLVKRGG